MSLLMFCRRIFLYSVDNSLNHYVAFSIELGQPGSFQTSKLVYLTKENKKSTVNKIPSGVLYNILNICQDLEFGISFYKISHPLKKVSILKKYKFGQGLGIRWSDFRQLEIDIRDKL